MTEMPASYSKVADRPRFSEVAVGGILHDAYGVDGDLHPLPSERDQNFRVVVDGVPRYVAKVSNATEHSEVVDLQCRAMEHLATAGIDCPVAVPGLDGQTVRRVDGHLFWILTFLPGELMARRRERSPELLHAFGMFLGRVTHALADFEHPAAERDLQWDVTRSGDVMTRYLSDVDEARRPLLEVALRDFTERVVPALPSLPRSVIHNDANDHNVLIDGDAITGLIDFGDMVHSVTVNEVAVGCAYAALGQPDPCAAIRSVVDGYAASAPLSDLERRLLPDLVRTRLATSVAISAHQHALEPHNAYLTVSEEQAWRVLAELTDEPPNTSQNEREDPYANG